MNNQVGNDCGRICTLLRHFNLLRFCPNNLVFIHIFCIRIRIDALFVLIVFIFMYIYVCNYSIHFTTTTATYKIKVGKAIRTPRLECYMILILQQACYMHTLKLHFTVVHQQTNECYLFFVMLVKKHPNLLNILALLYTRHK